VFRLNSLLALIIPRFDSDGWQRSAKAIVQRPNQAIREAGPA
jgi:hypothetical protein